MQIFLNDKLTNKNNILSSSPAIQEARTLWGKEDIYEKSAIDLQIFHNLPFGSITLLYGPRQIGKTATLRLYASQLTDSDTVIITDCSAIVDKADLQKHLDTLVRGNTTIILDEVQSVDGWHLALRALHSEGKLVKARVICTGSEARYILESGERLPGRRGRGKTILLRPWSFREYVNFFYKNEVKDLSKIKLQHITQKWLDEQPKLLQSPWQEYCNSGGFPKIIAETRKYGTVSDETMSIYLDWIMGTWSKQRTPLRSLEAVSRRIIETMNSRVSYETLKKGTDILSTHTIKSLIDLQEDHFAIRSFSRYDPQKKKFLPAKLRKIYPVDPLVALLFVALGWRHRRNIYEQTISQLNISECALALQTLRREDEPEIGYIASDKTHSEIDFYIDGCAIELKSNGNPTPGQMKLLQQCQQAYVVRQEKLPLVAYLLGEDRI